MNNIEKLKPFIEEYNDGFYQMIEDIRNYLRNNNKEYIEIKKQIYKLVVWIRITILKELVL